MNERPKCPPQVKRTPDNWKKVFKVFDDDNASLEDGEGIKCKDQVVFERVWGTIEFYSFSSLVELDVVNTVTEWLGKCRIILVNTIHYLISKPITVVIFDNDDDDDDDNQNEQDSRSVDAGRG